MCGLAILHIYKAFLAISWQFWQLNGDLVSKWSFVGGYLGFFSGKYILAQALVVKSNGLFPRLNEKPWKILSLTLYWWHRPHGNLNHVLNMCWIILVYAEHSYGFKRLKISILSSHLTC